MKKSSLILMLITMIFVLFLIASNLVLKEEYNKIDKQDPFWNLPGSFISHRIQYESQSLQNETKEFLDQSERPVKAGTGNLYFRF